MCSTVQTSLTGRIIILSDKEYIYSQFHSVSQAGGGLKRASLNSVYSYTPALTRVLCNTAR